MAGFVTSKEGENPWILGKDIKLAWLYNCTDWQGTEAYYSVINRNCKWILFWKRLFEQMIYL